MNLQAILPRALTRRDGMRPALGRIWKWWWREILSFVPPRLRAAFDRQERILLVSVRDGQLRIEFRHGADRQIVKHIGMVGGLADKTGEGLDLPEADRVIVELSPAYAARRQVSLPIGTEDRLEEVLGYEMDRLTPFAASELYYDYCIAGRDPARRVVYIDLAIALRRTVDDILDRLDRNGIQASQLTLAGADSSTNLLPKSQRASSAPQLSIVPTALSGLAAVLAIVAVAYPLVLQRIELGRLEVEASELRPAALAADKLRTEIASTAEQSNFFAAKRNDAPTKIRLLDELAAVIPDDTWLTRVQVDGDTVRINGESEGASSLIALIEASELLGDARFSSPVTKNPRTSNDRFVIEAQIRRAEGGS